MLETPDPSQPRLLIIDDDPTIRHLLAAIMGRAGFDVDVAADGEEGYAKLDAENPDIVLLDLMMPKVDGNEVLRRMRANHPALPPRTVLVSGAGKERLRDITDIAGIVEKPFDLDELVRTVRNALARATALPGVTTDAASETAG